MISIIVCSKNKQIPTLLKRNIQDSIGTDYELVIINNSRNDYSIFTAYNIGILQSKYPYLCFIHEDILFHTQDWGKILITHLEDPQTGIVGVAGGSLVTRIPAHWPQIPFEMQYVNIVQSDKRERKKTERIKQPLDFPKIKSKVFFLDGLFLAGRNEIFKKFRFDESLSGFHGYDLDISLKSHFAGYTNYVIYDILIEHFSGGKTNNIYFRNIIEIFKKWEAKLPLVDEDFRKIINLSGIEENQLNTLLKKLSRKSFPMDEIINEIKHFAQLLETDNALKYPAQIRRKVFSTRLLSAPQHLFK